MKYDATEEELQMIEHGETSKASSSGYIACIIDTCSYYLTVNGEVKRGPDLKKRETYHDSFDIAKEFFAKWIKSKEIQEKIEIKDKIITERMSHIEFRVAIKEMLK